MDFTLLIYKSLLQEFISRGYYFVTFKDFIYSKIYTNNKSFIILRHDVDRLPQNALRTAEIEYSLGIKGSYYFRIVPESFNVDIIKNISGLGHEIGYHYEEIDTVVRRQKSAVRNTLKSSKAARQTHFDNLQTTINYQLPTTILGEAFELFKVNLEKIRSVFPVTTICAHGSPLSPFDNKLVWNNFNYKDLGIIGDPNFDIDWDDFGYLTDTGRRWDGDDVSVRDKAPSSILPQKGRKFKSTFDIIKYIDGLPDKLMITVHPQRWNDKLLPWATEYILQNTKNVIKKYFFVKN